MGRIYDVNTFNFHINFDFVVAPESENENPKCQMFIISFPS